MSADAYQLVRLPNGTYSLHSAAYAETMHPGLGPAAEAEALYVRQLKLSDRLRGHAGEFVVWDVGLGAAANALAMLRASRDLPHPNTATTFPLSSPEGGEGWGEEALGFKTQIPSPQPSPRLGGEREPVAVSKRASRDLPVNICLHSFDHSTEPLRFALAHKESLGYFRGYEAPLDELSRHQNVEFEDGPRKVTWQLHIADFPRLLARAESTQFPKPHAILFDAFSPARNPEMWTLPLFTDLFRLLDPSRPCALATYSRSTMVRVALLLAGFFAGHGEPSGLKEETTVAASALSLIEHPLDRAWLQRARKSGSAEPLVDTIYRQAPLSEKTWLQLQAHPQFRSGDR